MEFFNFIEINDLLISIISSKNLYGEPNIVQSEKTIKNIMKTINNKNLKEIIYYSLFQEFGNYKFIMRNKYLIMICENREIIQIIYFEMSARYNKKLPLLLAVDKRELFYMTFKGKYESIRTKYMEKFRIKIRMVIEVFFISLQISYIRKQLLLKIYPKQFYIDPLIITENLFRTEIIISYEIFIILFYAILRGSTIILIHSNQQFIHLFIYALLNLLFPPFSVIKIYKSYHFSINHSNIYCFGRDIKDYRNRKKIIEKLDFKYQIKDHFIYDLINFRIYTKNDTINIKDFIQNHLFQKYTTSFDFISFRSIDEVMFLNYKMEIFRFYKEILDLEDFLIDKETVLKPLIENFVLRDLKFNEKDKISNKSTSRKHFSSYQNFSYNYYLNIKKLWKNQKHTYIDKNYKFDLNIGIKILATITMCPLCKHIFSLKEVREKSFSGANEKTLMTCFNCRIDFIPYFVAFDKDNYFNSNYFDKFKKVEYINLILLSKYIKDNEIHLESFNLERFNNLRKFNEKLFFNILLLLGELSIIPEVHNQSHFLYSDISLILKAIMNIKQILFNINYNHFKIKKITKSSYKLVHDYHYDFKTSDTTSSFDIIKDNSQVEFEDSLQKSRNILNSFYRINHSDVSLINTQMEDNSFQLKHFIEDKKLIDNHYLDLSEIDNFTELEKSKNNSTNINIDKSLIDERSRINSSRLTINKEINLNNCSIMVVSPEKIFKNEKCLICSKSKLGDIVRKLSCFHFVHIECEMNNKEILCEISKILI